MEKKEGKMIKLGNTSFRKGIASIMKYRDFKTVYANKLKGIEIDAAWEKLGGKLPKQGD